MFSLKAFKGIVSGTEFAIVLITLGNCAQLYKVFQLKCNFVILELIPQLYIGF